ncbi:hypothetical protein JKP88DRAFT_198852 [Tribonema minus]|uniref:Peptidase S74 domain-containing protein n=1 Tax=Tribonema minus TaxID=303371 RepID=A0A835YYF2_9STRA|nr:hypothetical protein JKP88DRAFT_198852 [Tribonema minus]
MILTPFSHCKLLLAPTQVITAIGGLSSAGGLTVTTGGAAVNGALTVSNGITSGGLTSSAGATVTGDVTILTGGLQATRIITATGGLSSDGGLTVTTGGAAVAATGGLSSAGGLTVTTGGAAVNGALTVSNGITSGGLTSSAGATVTGDVTILTGGLQATRIITATGGLSSDGGLTVTTGGAAVAGALTVSTTISTGSTVISSDRRLKENIVPLSATLNDLSHIMGVRFTWREGTPEHRRDKDAQQIGFIAQNVKTVFPELVGGDDEKGRLGVNYAGFAPILVEGVKDLGMSNALQAQELEQLRVRVDSVERLAEEQFRQVVPEHVRMHDANADALIEDMRSEMAAEVQQLHIQMHSLKLLVQQLQAQFTACSCSAAAR